MLDQLVYYHEALSVEHSSQLPLIQYKILPVMQLNTEVNVMKYYQPVRQYGYRYHHKYLKQLPAL